MQFNHKLGVFLVAPFALLTLSATNVHADNIQKNNTQIASTLNMQAQSVVQNSSATANISSDNTENSNSESGENGQNTSVNITNNSDSITSGNASTNNTQIGRAHV